MIRGTTLVLGALLLTGMVATQGEELSPGAQLPDLTFQVKGVEVSLGQMEAYDAILPPSEPHAVPDYDDKVPGPLLIPGAEGGRIVPVGPSKEVALPAPSGDASLLASPPIKSFVGMVDDNTAIPPDTHGAAGPAHLVSLLNRGFAVFDKMTGAVLSGPISLQAFWASLGIGPGQPAQNLTDPKVLYDQYSGRFVATTLGRSSGTNNTWVLFGVSVTSDPTGTWNLFAIDADTGTLNRFVDYPGFGLDGTSIYVAANTFSVTSPNPFMGGKFWVINKASLPAGPLTVSQFTTTSAEGAFFQPTHAFGASAVNYLLNGGWTAGGTSRAVKIRRFSYPGPVLTILGYVFVADYLADPIEDAPQPGCSQAIDVGDDRLMNAVLRNGKIFTTNTVDDVFPDGTGKTEIGWYEIDPAKASVPGPYFFADQMGRVSAASRWYYYPSIAVNVDGCIALGFTGSGDVLPGAYYTSRQPTDPPGFMRPPVLLKAGEAAYYKTFGGGRNRWGDYSATSIDPTDDRTFWTIQEYGRPQVGGVCPTDDTGRYGTWWGSFTCACATGADCSDGVVCNGSEICSGGNCQAGAPPTCDDANSCTSDACGSTTVVYSADFQSGAAGWTHAAGSGGGDTWHLAGTTCTGGDPALPSTMYVSNGNAGPGCTTTGTREVSVLRSPTIALPAVGAGETLSLFFDVLSYDYAGTCIFVDGEGAPNYDAHEVKITVNGGATYTSLNGCTPLTDGNGGIYTGRFDVTSFAGAATAQIAFFYDSAATNTDPIRHAFAVDNVRILKIRDVCVNTTLPNGTSCNDGNATTCTDLCTGGVCAGTFVAEPTEINGSLRLSKAGGTQLNWTDAPGPYNAYRGSRVGGSTWAYNQTCLAPGLSSMTTSDASNPAANSVFYYLVSRKNQCRESILGRDSDSSPDPNPAPCP